MKKTVKLSEVDLKRIVNRVIKEQSEVNEYFGGSLQDVMGYRVDELIDFLQKYKEQLMVPKSIIDSSITNKIENMWFYIKQDMSLDTLAKSNRQGEKVRGGGETFPERVKRSIKNF